MGFGAAALRPGGATRSGVRRGTQPHVRRQGFAPNTSPAACCCRGFAVWAAFTAGSPLYFSVYAPISMQKIFEAVIKVG